MENIKYIMAKNIHDLKNNQAMIKQIASQIVLRAQEMLYQYFSHHLYAYFDANILQIVNMVVIIQDTHSIIPFCAKIGKSNTSKNAT